MKSLLFIVIAFLAVSCSSTSSNNQAESASKAAPNNAPTSENPPADVEISDLVSEQPSDVPAEAENPRIDVSVSGLQAGSAYLIGTFTDQRYRADTASINDQGFLRMEKNEPYRPGLYFIVFGDNTYLQILIDTDQTFTMKTSKANLVGDMVIEGNLENQLLYENLKFQENHRADVNRVKNQLKSLDPGSQESKDLQAQQNELNVQRKAHLDNLFSKYPNTFFTAFKKAGQNPQLKRIVGADGKLDKVGQVTQFRKDFWNDVDFNDDRLLSTPVISNKLERYITELTPQQPDSIKGAIDYLIAKLNPNKKEDPYYSFFVNWIGLKYEPGKTKLMDAEAVYVHMVQKYYTYDKSFWADSTQIYSLQLRAHEMSNSLIGQKGPDVRAKNQNGQFKSIYEMKAPYIVVYLYNPQCEHCAVETPKLVQMEKEWRSKGLAVFAIGIDTNSEEWKDYLQKNQMDGFTNVYDPTNKAIYATYYVNVTPEVYVLNPDRILIGKNLKVNQIQTVINRDKEKRLNG